MNLNFDPQELALNSWVAGALGSLVGLKFIPGLTFWERLTNGVSGALCAGFGGPALSSYLHISSREMAGFLSFAIGVLGLSLAARCVDAVRQLDLTSVVKRWLGQKES